MSDSPTFSVRQAYRNRVTSRAQQGYVTDRIWQVVDSSGQVVSRDYDRKVDADAAARFHRIKARRS